MSVSWAWRGFSLRVPSLGFHPGVWLLLMAKRRSAYPAGGSPDGALPLRARVLRTTFCPRQKVTKERPKGFALGNPTRGFPLDLLKDGANAPYPLIPAGLLEDPLRGEYPLRLRLRGRRPAAGDGGVPSFLSLPGPQAIARRARSRPQAGTPNTAN